MYKFNLLFSVALLAICSCGKTSDQEVPNNIQPEDNQSVVCKFISVTGFQQQLDVYDNRENHVILLHFHRSSKIDQFLLDDDQVSLKQRNLSESLISRHYPFDPMDPRVYLMYGGVSGTVRIYSDKDVAGIAAGEDLSDLFEVLTKGVIQYPEMTLIADGLPQSFIRMPFREYFSAGVVPAALGAGFIQLQVLSDEIDGSSALYFEIPIVGKLKDGEEKTVVFKGECPGKPTE